MKARKCACAIASATEGVHVQVRVQSKCARAQKVLSVCIMRCEHVCMCTESDACAQQVVQSHAFSIGKSWKAASQPASSANGPGVTVYIYVQYTLV